MWGDGDPEGVRQRAEEMQHRAVRREARRRPRRPGFREGSSIWKYVRCSRRSREEAVDAGYQDFADRWNPILDVFDEGRRAVRARGPPQRDRVRLLDDRAHPRGDRAPRGVRPPWDPELLRVAAGTDPVDFILEFRDRIYHVDCKDVKNRLGNGRNGRLSSHLAWADPAARAGTSSTGRRDVRRGRRRSGRSTTSVRRADLGRVGGRGHGPPALRRFQALEFVRTATPFDAARVRRGVRYR